MRKDVLIDRELENYVNTAHSRVLDRGQERYRSVIVDISKGQWKVS